MMRFIKRHSFLSRSALAAVAAWTFLTAPSRAADTTTTLLVLPFENLSGSGEYNWIGESFSRSLSNLMRMPGLYAIDADERTVAMERLGYPRNAILSRASAIQLAQQMKADLLVVGTYSLSGAGQSVSIAVSARLIDVKVGALVGAETQKGGPVADLQRLQGELAWACLFQFNPALPFSRDQLVEKSVAIPSRAFESFVKGMLIVSPEDRMNFLRKAVKEAKGKYPQAVFELGRTSYLNGDYNEAIKWLAEVPDSSERISEAQFYLAVSLQRTSQFGESLKLFKQLLSRLPLAEMYNNTGALNFEQNKPAEALSLFKTAAELAPRDADVLFNFGYVAWKNGDFALAAEQMKKALARRAQDGEASYVLSRSLRALGGNAEAQEALENAKRTLPHFAEWETKGNVPDLLRLKTQFNLAAYYQLSRKVADLPKAQAVSSEAEELLAHARGFYLSGHDQEALDQLNRLLRLAPDNAEAHLLAGQVYERTGDSAHALNSLKAAVFWNDRLAPAHVLLGKIYLLQKNCAEANASLRKALDADPQHLEAQALKRTIEASCNGPR